MGEFVHLHLHSEYSLLDGACRVADIPRAAKEAGHTAVAMTDHGVLYGAVAFYRACKAEGIKPIIGCEVYVARNSRFSKEGKNDFSGDHLILLVENEIGYRNLIQMVSQSFIEGFYMRPRVDEELLRAHHEGLIALSACLAGKIPQAILSGDYVAAKATALEYRSLFGEGNFYLEVQDHLLSDEKRVAMTLKALSEETGIPLVATNDVHYLRRQDAEMQSVLMCIQTNRTLTEGRPIGFETDEFYYKSTEEMKRLFAAYPGAIENTVKIAERCQFDFTFGKYYLPTYSLAEGQTHQGILRELCFRGFEERIGSGRIVFDKATKEEYQSRLEYELSVIHEMGFDAYFLIVRDFVMYAKTHDIPVGPGRGSGAGSLVAFCIGITDVDSIRYDLLFERFLNPERQTMPDFDIDFCYEKRDRVISYVKEKYGDDHVAQIITFGTLAARAAVRDVGRVLGMSYTDVDAVAKLIPGMVSLTEAMKRTELKEKYEGDEAVKRLLDLSLKVEGMPRHASTHAAGVVITAEPVSHYVPIAVNGENVVTEYDMDTIASLGLVKFDFLGLRYLTIIEKTVEQIHRSEPKFRMDAVSFEDVATYKMIAQGKTEGVFQLESAGMRRVLADMKPTTFDDIIAVIALYRPGPMDSIGKFIARKHGEETVAYRVPALADILGSTYGCIVYQEQVMQIFRALAGYSFARADLVRRAMAKKKEEVMKAERSDFITGCAEHGIAEGDATAIFDEMLSFASYAFNKSHATAYAMISYRTAYLKAHYPAEYFAALMTCGVVCDPQKFDIRVLPPDINESGTDFIASRGAVRYGFLAIKNLGRLFVDALIAEREHGKFRSFEDFVERMARGDLNRKQLESLIKCGCFDSLGIYRSRLLAVYEEMLARAGARAQSNVTGQMDFFSGALGTPSALGSVTYPEIPEFPLRDLLAFEKELAGIYFSGNLFDHYAKHAAAIPHTDIAEILESFDENGEENGDHADKERVTLTGFVAGMTKKTTKRGDTMLFLQFADRTGTIEVIVFPKQYQQYATDLQITNGLCVIGTISAREDEKTKIVAERIQKLSSNEEYEKTLVKPKKLYLRVPGLQARETQVALRILSCVPGNTPIVIYDLSSGKYLNARGYDAEVTDKLLHDLQTIFGEANVVFK